jgi:uncharacterized protein YjbJ (UPF0337 family)
MHGRDPGCQRFVMSMFRQCRRVHTLHETLEFPGSNRVAKSLEFRAGQATRERELSPNLSSLSTFISHTRVIIHMNTKMILAAVALSLSLAACAKKEEPAEAAQDAAATANEAAGQAQEAAGDAAGDAAAPAEAPAEQPPAQPQQ